LSEILKYPKIAKVYTRDRMEGKMLAKREFRYIDFLVNRDSFCIREGLSDAEAIAFAKHNSGLPKEYVADKIVIEATETCRHLNGGIIEDLIDATVSAFRVDAKMMIKVKELLESLATKVADIDGVTQITKMTDSIINISGTIPGKITKLLELREAYAKAQSKTIDERRGGGEIGNSYDGSGIEKYSDTGEVEKLD